MASVNEGFVMDVNGGDFPHQPHTNKVSAYKESGDVELFTDKTRRTKEQELYGDDSSGHSRNVFGNRLKRFWMSYSAFFERQANKLKKVALFALMVAGVSYVAAVVHQFQKRDQTNIDWCRGYGMAFILFGIVGWTIFYYSIIVPFLVPHLVKFSHNKAVVKTWKTLRIIIGVGLVVLLAAFLIWDTSSEPNRLISMLGLLIFLAAGYIFSKDPSLVKWKTVYMGLGIQFLMGLIAIRWNTGRQAFKCVGTLAQDFLNYSTVGATVVYGERNVIQDAVFAFNALSAIFFVSMIVQVLFFLGWMQQMCLKLGWFIQVAMDTTVMESVNTVSSVFLGMTEAPLLYKPYLKDLTKSEMHAVMAGGFATIAGTVFAAFTSFGVDPSNIITASIMTAPAALCYAKLVYPETSQSKTDSKNIQMLKSEETSIMDAAIQGAWVGINMISGIISTVIACVSIVAFFNSMLEWFGGLAGFPDCNIESILAYVLYPLVWIMGVQTIHCFEIAKIIAVKLTVNEFVAYIKLGKLKKTGVLTPRTEAIATYALCSFANPGSIGILISTLTSLCPPQRHTILEVSLRAFLCAVVISFLTACIAGVLMPEEGFSD